MLLEGMLLMVLEPESTTWPFVINTHLQPWNRQLMSMVWHRQNLPRKQMIYFMNNHGMNMCCVVLSCSIMSHSLWPYGPWPTNLLCPQGFSRQEQWSGLSYLPPGDLPNLGIKSRSSSLQVDSFPSEPPGKPKKIEVGSLSLLHGIHEVK